MMNITYEKALLLYQEKQTHNLHKDPGCSIVFASSPQSKAMGIMLIENEVNIFLQAFVYDTDRCSFIDRKKRGLSITSKEEFLDILSNHPAHFEWFLFNF